MPNSRCPRKHCQCNISDASNLRCGPTRDATCLSQYVNLLNRTEADRAVEDDSARLPSPFLPLRRVRVGTRLLSKFILGRNQFLRDERSDEGASASSERRHVVWCPATSHSGLGLSHFYPAIHSNIITLGWSRQFRSERGRRNERAGGKGIRSYPRTLALKGILVRVLAVCHQH